MTQCLITLSNKARDLCDLAGRGGMAIARGLCAALRFALIVCSAFAGLRFVARRRLTYPSLYGRPQPSTS